MTMPAVSPKSPAFAPETESRVSSTKIAQRCVASILERWSLTSLDEVLPADLRPSLWNEHILKKMSTLAKHETLEAGRSILQEQITRRRRDDMKEGKVVVTVQGHLIKRDLEDILAARQYSRRTANKTSSSRDTSTDIPQTNTGNEEWDVSAGTVRTLALTVSISTRGSHDHY